MLARPVPQAPLQRVRKVHQKATARLLRILHCRAALVDGDFEVAERLLSSPTETERKKVVELAFEIQYRDFPDPEYQDVCLYWDEGKVYFGG